MALSTLRVRKRKAGDPGRPKRSRLSERNDPRSGHRQHPCAVELACVRLMMLDYDAHGWCHGLHFQRNS
jgi:hypothetical protein